MQHARKGFVRCALAAVRTVCCWLLLSGMPLHAAPANVVLAATAMPPYMDVRLLGQGYVAELVRAAFEAEGYVLDIRFYPPARARALLAAGEVDGLLPVGTDPAMASDLLLSDSFPGAVVGLMKSRKLALSYPANAAEDPIRTLQAFSAYRMGAVREIANAPGFESAKFLKREWVSDDLQNLDKLGLGRIDLVLIDKYRAGELLATQRPHLIGKLDFLDPPLFQSRFHVAFSAHRPNANTLRATFNRGLAKLVQKGETERIMARHGLSSTPRTQDRAKVLTVATVANADMLIMKRLSAQFEKNNPGVRIEWRVLDENTLRTRMMTDLAVGQGEYDVMTIGSYETPLWAAQGWLEVLEPLPARYEVDDLLPMVRDSLSWHGKLHALPFYAESSMTYYRTDLLAKVGQVMPERPTWTEIRRLAALMHDPAAGIAGICLRGKPGWGENMALLTTMVNAHGGRWFDTHWVPQIDSPQWLQAVDMYVNLLRRYGPSTPVDLGFNENLRLFSEGRCAIWVDATVAASTLLNPKRSPLAGQFGFVRAPSETTRVGASWLWAWALAVPASSRQKPLARRFVEWASSQGYIQAVAQQEGWQAVPPGTRKSTYRNPAYLAQAPFAAFVAQAMNDQDARPLGRLFNGQAWVAIPEFPAIGQLVGEELALALQGKKSTTQALQSANAAARQRLQDAGYVADKAVSVR